MIGGGLSKVLPRLSYLRPTPQHLPVDRWVPPDRFDWFKEEGLAVGFEHVESGPLVRSSYHADEPVQAPEIARVLRAASGEGQDGP